MSFDFDNFHPITGYQVNHEDSLNPNWEKRFHRVEEVKLGDVKNYVGTKRITYDWVWYNEKNVLY